jgi:hypothetical protein
MSKHPVLLIFLPCAVSLATAAQEGAVTKDLNDLFSAKNISSVWKRIHCDLDGSQGGALRATFWKGYETTGFETTRLSASDWSAWKSLRFDVENPYPRPVSVYVRISNQSGHPAAETYTAGTVRIQRQVARAGEGLGLASEIPEAWGWSAYGEILAR